MFLEPRLIVELALLGLGTGFLAGLLGIGGGMLMVPVVTFILGAKGFPANYTVKMAVATSLATICFTSIASVRAHHLRGAVLWPVALKLAPGIVVGSALGAQLAVAIPGNVLSMLFALFVSFSATQMVLDRKPKPHRTLPGTPGMLAVGGGIGVLSALVGAGGAFVSVPFMQCATSRSTTPSRRRRRSGSRSRWPARWVISGPDWTCPRCHPAVSATFTCRGWSSSPWPA